ncbi:hypothetical protein AXG93_1050s1020 [Marchantia polymorpha subsp. ruderalis]|uniref:Bidirectional sugar transporter SWEET n=1 Tax=Marchantia polymorpha subsp. ruderalis TaxID=1480154 RepID=A0A176VF93_MARPO|nr:hypothetical protein AXG93_1050s1020 [Marchantia polymorpha subsp. ruderalis]
MGNACLEDERHLSLTFWRIWRKKTVEDFSGLPYLGCFFNCAAWTFYGLPLVIEGGTLVVTINGAGAALFFTFVLIFLIFSRGKERLKVGTLFVAVIAFLVVLIVVTLTTVRQNQRKTVVGSTALAINIIMYSAPLSNTKLVIKTRSVEFLPFFFTLMSFINPVVWTAYAAVTSDLFIMIPNAIGIALGSFNLLLYGIFHKSKPKQKPKVEDKQVENINLKEQLKHSADSDGTTAPATETDAKKQIVDSSA